MHILYMWHMWRRKYTAVGDTCNGVPVYAAYSRMSFFGEHGKYIKKAKTTTTTTTMTYINYMWSLLSITFCENVIH